MNHKLETLKRSDVPKELLKSPSIRHLFSFLFFDWIIIILSSIMMFRTPNYLYPFWILIIGGRLHGLGVILHDLTHVPYRKNKSWKLRLLEIFAGYPIASTVNAMGYHHLRHHRNTLFKTDPYFSYNKKCSDFDKFILTFKKGPLFVLFWILGGFIGSMAYYIPHLRGPYARLFLQDISKSDLKNNAEVIECCKEARYQSIFHLLLFGLALKFNSIFYAYYMALPVAGILCIYRLLIEHEYDIVEDKKIYTILECSFDHHTSLFGRMLIAPHHIGYHCMHHLHPSVGVHALESLSKWYLANSRHYAEIYGDKEQIKLLGSVVK